MICPYSRRVIRRPPPESRTASTWCPIDPENPLRRRDIPSEQSIVQRYRVAGAGGPDGVRGAGAVQADAAGAQRAVVGAVAGRLGCPAGPGGGPLALPCGA